MPAFEDIHLSWHGRGYVIRANRVMGALARIEDVITFAELHQAFGRGTVPIAKLSAAYGAVLRYAGARVTDEEVYLEAFSAEGQETVLAAVQTLMEMMLPPSLRDTADAGQEAPPANPPAAAS